MEAQVDYLILFGSIAIISLVSLIGVFTINLKEKKLGSVLDSMVAFAIGALLGDVFIHLFPEISAEAGFSLDISLAILSGIIVFFVLEKVVHWQHCHNLKHGEVCHRFTYMSLYGDMLHNFIDGVIMAGAFLGGPVLGMSTAIAVFLHEVPQEIGDYAVLIKGGFTRKKALLYNFLTSLTAFAGAIITLFFGKAVAGSTPILLAFAAGSFLYIAGTDLIPELHKDFSAKKALTQVFFILLGVAVMASLLLLE